MINTNPVLPGAPLACAPLPRVMARRSARGIRSTALFLLIALSVSGCADNSADGRLRTILGMPADQPLTEALVAEKINNILPIGTAEPLLAEKAKASGIGRDTLSSYNLVKERNLVVIRVGFDPTTFGVAKESWVISLQLDSSLRVQSIGTKRYLTGL